MTNNNKNTSLHRYRTSDHSGAEERSKTDRAATKAAPAVDRWIRGGVGADAAGGVDPVGRRDAAGHAGAGCEVFPG
jgi:hypothetical protein